MDWSGGPNFNHRSRHPKIFQNVYPNEVDCTLSRGHKHHNTIHLRPLQKLPTLPQDHTTLHINTTPLNEQTSQILQLSNTLGVYVDN